MPAQQDKTFFSNSPPYIDNLVSVMLLQETKAKNWRRIPLKVFEQEFTTKNLSCINR